MTKPEGFDFRPANDNEMAQVQRLGNYVFASPPGDDNPSSPLLAQWTQCAFTGEKLAACSGIYPFIVRLNGNTTPMQGVTLVGTEPEFRRRGLVRQLITDLLHRGHEQEQSGSILLASRGAIYQRFGYGLASIDARYEFDPKEAGLLNNEPAAGKLERMNKDDALPLASAVHKKFCQSRNMMAIRSAPVWDRYFADVAKDKAYCVVHFDENDIADGYCIYTTKWDQTGNGHEMQWNDFAWTNIGAYRAIWTYLTSHDLVTKVTWDSAPEDDPAPGLLLEPRCVNRRTIDRLWYRIIDISATLSARAYDCEDRVVVQIINDDICEWNNGSHELATNHGDVSITRTDKSPDITADINAYASLVSGFASATWLHELGRISVSNQNDLHRLDRLFATRHRPGISFGF